MTTYLACYDLKKTKPGIHDKFIDIAIDEGWLPIGFNTDISDATSLPNTSLETDADTLGTAIEKFRSVARRTAAEGYIVNLERVAIVEVGKERYWDEGKFKF